MTEREIFTAAVALTDPARRDAFLREACAGQDQLRRRVEALLRAHDNASAFLGTPAMEQVLGTTAPDVPGARPGDAADITTHANSEFLDDLRDDRTLSYLSASEKPGSLGRLGHYEIEAVLGRGGFGTVLKAFDERLHRTVAIKMLSPELAATSPPRKRFLREARAAAAIRHQNVIAIYAVEDQPIPYFVMECVPGETLQQYLDAHGPLDVADVLSIGQQTAAGLAAAHAQGLVHRDIKPSNILLEGGSQGIVRISDFGLARTADDASLTQSGTVAGTPLFMSPEQALGRSIDQRSDQFSLGSVLYQMVTGRPPFRASSAVAVLRRVIEDPPRPIAEIIPECPDWLSAIIAKLMAKAPEDRFESAAQVAELLGRCLADVRANRPIRLPKEVPPAPSAMALKISTVLEEAPPARQNTSPQPRGTLIAAALVACVLALSVTEATGVTHLAAAVIRLTRASGTLVIETDDPGIKVTIDGEEVQIRGAGVEQLTLRPGSYQVAATKDGKPVAQQLVTIARGGREVVRVTLEETEPGAGPASEDTDRERRVAEWALSKGAYVRLVIRRPAKSPEFVEVKTVADFPVESFDCDIFTFEFGTELTEADVHRLLDARKLDRLELMRSNLTDAGLQTISRMESLTVLNIAQSGVTDAGVPVLRRLHQLRNLNLFGLPVTAAGLRTLEGLPLTDLNAGGTKLTGHDWEVFALFPHLKGLSFQESANFGDADLAQLVHLKQIEGLHLGYASVSNAGLSQLRQLSELSILFVSDNAKLTDAAVEPLSQVRSLRELHAERTNLTADGIARLHAALPECRIHWDGGISEPASLVDRRAAEWVLARGGSVCVNGQEHAIQSVDALPSTAFRLTSIILHHRPSLSAGEVAKLEGLKYVEHLRLDGTPLTDDALALLAGLTSLRSLNLQATGLTDQALVHLRNLTAMEHLAIHGNPNMGDDGLKHLSGITALKYFEARQTAIGDAGLKHIQHLPNLIEIVLEGTQVTDRGLADLPATPTLTSIQLQSTAVSDDGLEWLAQHPSLRSILLYGTKVTDAGVRKLASALPECRIAWDGGVIEPAQ